jgi:hypothetical protein
MSFELSDIPSAVTTYLDTNVSTVISAVTPADQTQDVLTPGQDGTFSVTVTNASAPEGVRLINVQYFVKVTDDKVAQLTVPTTFGLECFSSLTSTTALKPGTLRSDMFVRDVTDPALDEGQTRSIHLELHCVDQGDAKIICRVNAEVDESSLFPISQSPNRNVTVTVV